MAHKVNTVLLDDLDPEVPADETVRFGLDGTEYEIDLAEWRASELRSDLARFVAAARRVPKRGAAQPARRSQSADRQRNADIRSWAQDHGYSVGDRGRIPGDVVAAYDAAQ